MYSLLTTGLSLQATQEPSHYTVLNSIFNRFTGNKVWISWLWSNAGILLITCYDIIMII